MPPSVDMSGGGGGGEGGGGEVEWRGVLFRCLSVRQDTAQTHTRNQNPQNENHLSKQQTAAGNLEKIEHKYEHFQHTWPVPRPENGATPSYCTSRPSDPQWHPHRRSSHAVPRIPDVYVCSDADLGPNIGHTRGASNGVLRAEGAAQKCSQGQNGGSPGAKRPPSRPRRR